MSAKNIRSTVSRTEKDLLKIFKDLKIKLPNPQKESLRKVLTTLPPKEEMVLRLYYGIGIKEGHPCTLEEIAKEYNITRSRAGQIKDKAVRRLIFRQLRFEFPSRLKSFLEH